MSFLFPTSPIDLSPSPGFKGVQWDHPILSHQDSLLQGGSLTDALEGVYAYVEASLKDYECPDIHTRLKLPTSRYKAMSAMQKAIRRGNVPMAQSAAHALWSSGFAPHFWRRMAVITLEDVGIGVPMIPAIGNLMAADKVWRGTMDQRKAMFWVTELLCLPPKSRDACLVEVFTHQKASPYKTLAAPMESFTANQLVDVALGGGTGQEQLIALGLMLMNGEAHKGHGIASAEIASNRLAAFYKEIDFPNLLQLAVPAHLKAAGGTMQTTLPFLWGLMRSSPYCQPGVDHFGKIEDNSLVGGVYAATWDKHVSEGNRAFRRFAKENDTMRDFCADHSLDAEEFIATAAFYTEGAAVENPMTYEGSSDLLWSMLSCRMAHVGTSSTDTIRTGFLLFKSQIPHLNALRAQVLS